jgi:hypothetical protein
MSDSASTPFAIGRGWMDSLLASSRQQVQDCATRHSAMSGAASSSNLFWFRTGPCGKESGLFASMEHGGNVHFTPKVSELVNFLKSLPESARNEIGGAFHPTSEHVL